MATAYVLITGNTYPVREALRALGGIWKPKEKAWSVPADKEEEAKALVAGTGTSPTTDRPRRIKCVACGRIPDGRYGDHLYRSGECRDCYEERKMGY